MEFFTKTMEKYKMNIAIISYSGIGNLVHWTPCIKSLQRLGYNIYIFTWERCKNILDEFVVWGYINGISYDMAQTEWPDIIFDYLLVPAVGAHLTPNLTDRCKEVIRQSISAWGKHESEYMMDFAYKLGYKDKMPSSFILLSSKNRSSIVSTIFKNQSYPKFIAINASYLKDHNWPLKHWGNENYHQLVQRINNELELPCVLLGSKNDLEDAKDILHNTNNKNINLCGFSDNIQETLYILAESRFLVGNDGGLQHLANAMEIPTVTIFTFTNPIKNRPLGPMAKIVITKCDKRITCQHGHWRKCPHRDCRKISIQNVWPKIIETYNETIL